MVMQNEKQDITNIQFPVIDADIKFSFYLNAE